MKLINIGFSDEDYEILLEAANERKMSVQEYIRVSVLKKEASIFTVEEAYRRSCAIERGKVFTLPDLYSEEEWKQLPSNKAGGFGRRFFNYIQKNSDEVEFVNVVRRLARYRRKAEKKAEKEE